MRAETFGCLITEQLGGFDLSELPFPDDLADLKGKLHLGQMFLRVGQSNIRKYIAATLFVFNGGSSCSLLLSFSACLL